MFPDAPTHSSHQVRCRCPLPAWSHLLCLFLTRNDPLLPSGVLCPRQRHLLAPLSVVPPPCLVHPVLSSTAPLLLCSSFPRAHHGGLCQARPSSDRARFDPPAQGCPPGRAAAVKRASPPPAAAALPPSSQRQQPRRARLPGDLYFPHFCPAVAGGPPFPPRKGTGQGEPATAGSGGGAVAAHRSRGAGIGRPGGTRGTLVRQGSRRLDSDWMSGPDANAAAGTAPVLRAAACGSPAARRLYFSSLPRCLRLNAAFLRGSLMSCHGLATSRGSRLGKRERRKCHRLAMDLLSPICRHSLCMTPH